MSKGNKLIPELRFPEFVNGDEWLQTKLEKIGEPLMCKRILKEQTTTNPKNGVPFYKIGTFGKDADAYIPFELYDDFKNKYSFPNKGDILISASGTIGRLVLYDGQPAYFQDSNIIWLGNYESQVLNSFLFYCYSTIKWQTSDGGVISRLYNSDLKSIYIAFPKNFREQQKISSCLSSLDEVIAAHSQKLELLKNHKKGLMQNLFPQEGETVPKFRFKEFEKDGEWVEDILLNLALDGFSNGVFNDPKKVGSGYKLINVINMYSESPICENNLTCLELSQSEFEKNKVKYGDIFFTRSSLVPVGIAKSNIYLGSSEDITYDGHLIRMRPKKELILPVYLHYLLKTENVRRQMIAKGKTATMTTIGQADIACVEISYSKNPIEQQKIASCLSSLEALITAQAEKIEQLKLHKKGLMQGLFPKIV